MAWTIAKDSGAVSFTHWLEDGKGGEVLAKMGTPDGALPLSDGHAVAEDGEASRFEIFPGQSKFLYDDLFYHLPMMILVIGADGKILNCNKSALETLGYTEEELDGRHGLTILTEASRAKLRNEVYPQFFESGYFGNTEVKLMKKNGQAVDVLASAIGYKNAQGRVERSVAVLSDMSNQARTQTALRQSEQRFRNSFEAAAHGMAILSVDGRISAVNNSMIELLGVKELDILSKSFMDIVHVDDVSKVTDVVSKIRSEGGGGGHAELRFLGAEDKHVHALTSISAVRDSNGKVEQFILQMVDITSRQKAEEHLRQAQKMEAVGQLTGGIAHDFNNLLTVVIGNLQLIEGALEGNDKALKRAREAIDAATKGSELTKQLLAFARRQSLAPQELKVNHLIHEMEGILQRSVGEAVKLKVDLMKGDPIIKADPTQLETSILNLAINARDAMKDSGGGGRLTIETSRLHLDADYAKEHEEVEPGDYVMIAVSDTGAGIPKHLLHKVFQPFFTTKEVGKGTGLGLSMVFGFIKQSGGHMKVYSEEGCGTSFKMYLPLRAMDGEEKQPEAEEEPEAEDAKTKILVVEDQDNVRDVAVDFLESFGYEVLQAHNAIEALEMLQDNKEIALLFTDVVMPGGMNGFDLSQAAAQIRPDLKVIHASGYPKGAMVHQEEPRLGDNLISKPYQREDLRKIVEQTLAKE
ncbi:MAG: PAS domain S-box protein [Rhizobiales bacterium]|nr:PAS domain S-box protein [Hyphomicrobiales bacterium]